MKTLSKITLLGSGFVLAVSAQAAVSYGASNAGQPYVGVKVGQADVDDLPKKAMTYGVYGGYNFDQNLGAEVEFQGSDSKDYSVGNANLEYDVKTYGAYGTYRLNFNNTPFYAKGKLGVAKTDIEVKGKNFNYLDTSDKTGVAGGVGLGYQQGNFGVEAGYNLAGDANMLNVGAHLAF
ncbi:MAG: porin family protein [Moraxella sp.]|nr:porin family protein [Moraxella sp.]